MGMHGNITVKMNWKNALDRLPGRKRLQEHFIKAGHTAKEAAVGSAFFALLGLTAGAFFVFWLLRRLFRPLFDAWRVWAARYPSYAVLSVFFFGALFFLGFSFWRRKQEKAREQKEREHRKRHQLFQQKKEALLRGALGVFPEVYHWELSGRFPEIPKPAVHVAGTAVAVRVKARTFPGDERRKKFRAVLFQDAWELLNLIFEIAPNVSQGTVCLLYDYIDRAARFYEGAVLSVRAQKPQWEAVKREISADSFQNLARLDLRYDETREIEPHPLPEDPTQRLIDRLRREQPHWRLEDGELKPTAPPSGEDNVLEKAPLAAPKPQARTFSPPDSLWNELPALKFRERVKEKIEEMGFQILRERNAAAGGCLFVSEHPHPWTGGTYLIWAKQAPAASKVPAETLKEMAHMMEAEFCLYGLLLCTADYSPEAKALCRSLGVRLIVLEEPVKPNHPS